MGEMIAGIGLHRIHFEYVLAGWSPENIELGSLMRVMVDDIGTLILISILIAIGGALEVAFYVAEDAQVILLAQNADDSLATAVGITKESRSSAHTVFALAESDVDYFLQTAAALHHFCILANFDAFNLTSLEMVEQGSIVESVFLIVDTDDELSLLVGKGITADDVVAIEADYLRTHHQNIEERFFTGKFHF